MDRPWKFNHTSEVAFIVVRPLNLNDSPRLGAPFQSEISKSFCFFPCASKPINLEVAIPKTGFVAGETLQIYSKIRNTSNFSVASVEYVLRQIVTYTAEISYTKTKVEKINLCSLKGAGVGKQDSGEFQHSIIIPHVPPTAISGCNVLKLSYSLMVKVNGSGCWNKFKIEQPITIGTVPFMAPKHS